MAELAATGGREGGEGLRSSSWREPVEPRVLMLVVDEDRDGGSELESSETVSFTCSGVLRGVSIVVRCETVLALLFQPSRVT